MRKSLLTLALTGAVLTGCSNDYGQYRFLPNAGGATGHQADTGGSANTGTGGTNAAGNGPGGMPTGGASPADTGGAPSGQGGSAARAGSSGISGSPG